MTDNNISIRPAKESEAGKILELIKRLAEYEKFLDEVVADEATIYHSVFVEKSAEVVFAEEDGKIVPRIKISENVEKVTNPGYKRVWRLRDRTTGKDYVAIRIKEFEGCLGTVLVCFNSKHHVTTTSIYILLNNQRFG